MPKVYNLYLDESTTHYKSKQEHFCIAGIIVREDVHDGVLTTELNNLKKKIWSDLENPCALILHEKEVKEANRRRGNIAPDYVRFKKDSTTKQLYAELNKIIANNDVYIVAVSISKDKLNSYYPNPLRHNDEWTIALQLLLENFTHFLVKNNGKGQIYYEHINGAHKREMRRRFYTIKSMGTMYISPYEIQSRLMGICFPEKNENITGIQLSDFIPNDIARKHAGFSIKKKMNMRHTIERKTYDGKIREKARFGVKMIP